MLRQFFLALAIVSLFVSPAFAADDDDDDAEPAKPAAKTEQQDAKPAAKAKKAKSSSGSTSEARKIAKKAAGFAAGTAVGLPVAFVRLTADAIPEHAKSVPFIGESNNPALKWASRGLMIPTAFFSGFVQAPFYSVTNAWNAAVTDDEPFSKESFYLGEDAPGLTSD
jgi:hypothetical protein